ncbi:hypothetical protein, partial [Butyricimonas virosa]|uniref:hypothetical protein n=1 Tax=Butyricimonas virosa TaxID=544645 RepID=UPI00266BF2C1
LSSELLANKVVIKIFQNYEKILRMSPKRYKRRNNILYRLRKKGIRCVTKERTIFIPYGKNPCDILQVKQLLLEFNFVVQVYIE